MDTISFALLGIVQGLTEFLPVSSSGHLILARELLGMQSVDGLAIDAVLQLATILALFVYFRVEFWSLIVDTFKWITGGIVETKQKVLLLAIILGTIPAGIAGLLLEEKMSTVFRSAEIVAWMLIAGSLLMALAEWVHARPKESIEESDQELTVWKGIGVGLFQCLALVPGMSRSGSTISGGLLLGLTREDAARFGFLLSGPIILLSGLKKLLDLVQGGEISSVGFPLLVGSVVAFVIGLFAIHFLLRYLKNHTLTVFIVYRLVLAIVVLAILHF
jgi:undecaprenyl-diphosphatase